MSIDLETGEITDGGGDDRCPRCDEAINERIQAELDLRAAERELRRLRREAGQLRMELARQTTDSPEGKVARALGRYWIARCDKDRKRTRLGDKRIKAVVARLRDGYSAQYIARAIDGLAEHAWTNPSTGHKYDDLELVCRDEVKVERFHDLAEQGKAPTLMGSAWRHEFGAELPEAKSDDPF